MIDKDKIRALSMCIRADADFSNEGENWAFDLRREAADAIDLLLAEVEAARTALRQISAIEDKMIGGDWDEIEEARAIARGALAQRQGEGS